MTERLHFHFSLSCIGEGNGNPLQCSCPESPRDGGAWWAAIYGVAQSRTQLKWLSSSVQITVRELQKSSVQFSRSVVSLFDPMDCSARLPCPSPTRGAYSNSCPLSQWGHPTISYSVIAFSSCLQSFPASESLQISQSFASGGQRIGVSAWASVLPNNIQDWFPLGWTGWISLLSKGLSRVFSNTTVQKHQFFGAQLSL